MEKFILAQLILSLPGAVATYLLVLLMPDRPVLFIVISTIAQAVFLILVSMAFGQAIQRLVGINPDKLT